MKLELHPNRPSRSLLHLGLGSAICALGLCARPAAVASSTDEPRAAQPAADPDGLVLVPMLPEAVRELSVAPGKLLVCPTGSDGTSVELVSLQLEGPFGAIDSIAIDRVLRCESLFARMQTLIERLPEELSERSSARRYFAPQDAPEFSPSESADRMREIGELLGAYQAQQRRSGGPGHVELDFWLPLDQFFEPEAPAGSEAPYRLRLAWRDAHGELRESRVEGVVRRIARFARPSSSLQKDAPALTVHVGDLHVHSCHGEAIGACAPSTNCDAETLQTSGSYSFSQLKAGFEALGMDWFASTDHSYCVTSAAEYQQIRNELTAITTPQFVGIPDTELSCDEVGPQSGSDIGDVACLSGTQANHVGAHGIDTWKHGGSDKLLGYCNGVFFDALTPFTTAAAAIHSEGGMPIVHHPSTQTGWAWNSFEAAQGIESAQMHGVEIWAGDSPQAQYLSAWLDWLNAGRILFAYSGSDTHDAAKPIGANHVLLDGPMNANTLIANLLAGHSYLSNGPSLVIESAFGAAKLPMGTIEGFDPAAAPATIPLRVHYNLGTATGILSVKRGWVGSGEVTLCTSPPLSGEGVFVWNDSLSTSTRSWYRAELSGLGLQAYTNPIFFQPSGAWPLHYGVGLGGANVIALDSPSTPSLGSVQTFAVEGLAGSGSAQARLWVSGTAAAAGIPFAGGFVCIGLPALGSLPVPLVAGQGSVGIEIPMDFSLVGAKLYWQATSLHAGMPAGIAFSNGLQTTLCLPGS